MNLFNLYQELKEKQPHLYLRDAAHLLNVSEAELLSNLPNTYYLGNDFSHFLPELESLGLVKSIVRNDLAVHEKTGIYQNLDLSPFMGTAINMGGLDLRLFLKKWRHIFAYQPDNAPASFQFFDEYGQNIQKIYLTHANQLDKWLEIKSKYLQNETPRFTENPSKNVYQPADLEDDKIKSFQQEWKELKNVHHFRVVLSQYGIDRLQGLEIAPSGDTMRLQPEAVEYLLHQCVEKQITLLSFVHNKGMVQIQTGKVHNVVRARGWLNILDDKEEQFSLHLNDKQLAQIWFVRRPGSNGIVHSFEAYNHNRELILQLFGRQADAEHEPQEWQNLVKDTLQRYQHQ